MGSMLFFGPKAGAWGEEPDEGQAAPNANNTLRTVYRKPVLTHLFFLGCTLLYTVLFGTLIGEPRLRCGRARWVGQAGAVALTGHVALCRACTGVLAHFLSFYIFYGLFFVVIMLGFCRIPVRRCCVLRVHRPCSHTVTGADRDLCGHAMQQCDDTLVLETGGWGADVVDGSFVCAVHPAARLWCTA